MKAASISLFHLLIAFSTFNVILSARALGEVVPAVVYSANDGSVTIDASQLISVTSLDAPWRFAPNDDPRYADPAFDDSKWVLIQPGMDKLLADAHTPNVVDGSDWSRIHLRLLNATGPIGLLISTRNGIPYEVFANGQRIGAARRFASGATYLNRSTVIQVSAAKEIVLAIHCFSGERSLRHYDPIEKIEVSQYELMHASKELDHLSSFIGGFLIEVVISCAFFGCVLLGIALFLAQRNHREYLWLAICPSRFFRIICREWRSMGDGFHLFRRSLPSEILSTLHWRFFACSSWQSWQVCEVAVGAAHSRDLSSSSTSRSTSPTTRVCIASPTA